MFGGGSALSITSARMILGQYFKKNLGIAYGLSKSGLAISAMTMPHVLEMLLLKFKVHTYLIIILWFLRIPWYVNIIKQ